MDRRVVITGMEMITPLGIGMRETWEGLKAGKSGVVRISSFDCSSFQTQIAGEVKNFNFDDLWYNTGHDLKYLGKHSQFALVTTKMALENSGLNLDTINRRRIGVYLGSGEGEFDFDGFVRDIIESWDGNRVDINKFLQVGVNVLNPIREFEHDSNRPSIHISNTFGLYGPNSNCLTACAASSQAIGEAWWTIKRGNADIMVTGGSHSMIHPLGVIGFNLLTALSTQNDIPEQASKPFDMKRDGFVLGEGAGILILEELEHALNRNAKIWGEITGYGTSADAYRITDAHPDGRGAIAAMKMALDTAKTAPEDIDYINAHGTSTNVNDTVETCAIKQVFGDYAYKVPVSSIKSMLGHLIAAAGAVELMTCLLSIQDGIIPPTINYNDPDPQCDLDYVPNKSRKHTVNTALSNSFGFGGQNVALIVQKYTDGK